MSRRLDNYNERTPILSEGESGCLPARYVLAILGFGGFIIAYAHRVILSVTIVIMVKKIINAGDPNSVVESCPELRQTLVLNSTASSGSPLDGGGEFNWDTYTQAHILGAFYYGYVVLQIPGGIVAEKFCAKWLYGSGILVPSVLALFIPLAARWNVGALILIRVIQGLAEGVTFPAMNALIARWVPKMERSRFATFTFMGSPIGTVLALITAGVLSDSTFLGGWPSVFYVFGALGIIWFLIWTALIYESPEKHPRISKEELRFIRSGQDEIKRLPIPWKKILTSKEVWALVVTHFGQNWGFYTMLTELPTYLSNILHFNIKQNGILSSIPYLSQAIFAFVASLVADHLRRRSHLNISCIRKLMNSIAFFVPCLCMLCIAFIGCNPSAILSLLVVALGCNGFIYSGFNITHVDMSPDFAGTLMGITNCVANFTGFLAPAFVGRIIDEGQTIENWGNIFIVSAAMYFICGNVFIMFGSAEVQPWGITRNQAEPEENPLRRNTIP